MFRLKFPVVWWLVLGGVLLCGPSVLGKEIMLADGTSIEDEVREIGGGKIRIPGSFCHGAKGFVVVEEMGRYEEAEVIY